MYIYIHIYIYIYIYTYKHKYVKCIFLLYKINVLLNFKINQIHIL